MLLRSWMWSLLFLAKSAHGFKSIIDFLNANVSTDWNDDLEPVLMSLNKRIVKETFPLVQEVLYDEDIPTECIQSFVKISSGLVDQKLWAFRFFDASGGLIPGMIDVRFGSLGNYDECLGIRVPHRDEPEKVAFGGKYCTTSLKISRQPLLYRMLPEIVAQDQVILDFLGGANTTWLLELMEKMPIGYRVGICLPSTCDSSVIPHLIEKFGGKYGFQGDVLACRDLLSEEPIATGTLIAGIVVAIMVSVVTLGTIVDFLCSEDLKGVLRVVRCFSARTSYLKITAANVSAANSHLDCIPGIKVLSSFWILYSHTYAGDPALYNSGVRLFETLRNPVFSVVVQGILAVETFFALSGLLLYKSLKARPEVNNLPLPTFVVTILLRRALRLVFPAVGAVCVLYLLPLLTSGPGFDVFYPFFKINCDRRWWSIPLFVNNFWSFEETCLGNQWYNAADMQILCILLLPVLLMLRNPIKGSLVLFILINISILYTAGLTFYYDATPVMVVLPRRLTSILQLSLRIHDQCLPHLASVCVGIIGGYFVENHRNREMSRTLRMIGWTVFNVLLFGLVFVIYIWHRRGSISTVEAVAYGALYRPLWAMCVVWLVFVCSSRKAQCLRWILSRPNFSLLSRLSFCFYLMQMPVIMLKNFTARSAVPFTYYQNFRDFFADLVLNYMLAFVLFLTFEAPAVTLDMLTACKEPKPCSLKSDGEKVKQKKGNSNDNRIDLIGYKF